MVLLNQALQDLVLLSINLNTEMSHKLINKKCFIDLFIYKSISQRLIDHI